MDPKERALQVAASRLIPAPAEVEELLAGLGILALTEALDDPRLAATIRRLGIDVVRGAIDRIEARTALADHGSTSGGRAG